MTKEEFKKNAKEIFATGIRGIFSIMPIKRLLTERTFILALLLSILLTIFVSVSGYTLSYIERVTNLTKDIIPAILGLSLAGFAIVISQMNTETFKRTANIQEGKTHSLYQKTNAAFAIMCLSQLISLILSIVVSLIMPITVNIPVTELQANLVNIFLIFILTFILLYSLFSVFDIIYTIFASGQIVNFMFIKNKFDESN